MGYTTRIDQSEIDRSTTVGPLVDGIEVEAAKPAVKAKVVEPEKKAPAKTSRSAKTK